MQNITTTAPFKIIKFILISTLLFNAHHIFPRYLDIYIN